MMRQLVMNYVQCYRQLDNKIIQQYINMFSGTPLNQDHIKSNKKPSSAEGRPPQPFKSSGSIASPQIAQLFADFQRLTATLPLHTPVKSRLSRESINSGIQNEPLQASIKKIQIEFRASMQKLKLQSQPSNFEQIDLVKTVKALQARIKHRMINIGQTIEYLSKRIEYLSLAISTIGKSYFKKPLDLFSVIENIEKESTIQMNKLSYFYRNKLSSLQSQYHQLQQKIYTKERELREIKARQKKIIQLGQSKDGVIAGLQIENKQLRLMISKLNQKITTRCTGLNPIANDHNERDTHSKMIKNEMSQNQNGYGSIQKEQDEPIIYNALPDLDLSYISGSSSEEKEGLGHLQYWNFDDKKD